MFNKKLIMIAILIVSLLAISATSAAENSTGILDAPEDSVYLGDNESSVGTFDELSTLIANTSQGDVLELNQDYKSSGQEITINKPITIDGKGHTLDGNKNSRIFNIRAGNVVLKNITFINGKSLGNGGAITSKGNISIYDCNFYNNSANEGSAIYSEGDNLDIAVSSFQYNSAKSTIYVTKTRCSVYESKLINNIGTNEEIHCNVGNTPLYIVNSMIHSRKPVTWNNPRDLNMVNSSLENVSFSYQKKFNVNLTNTTFKSSTNVFYYYGNIINCTFIDSPISFYLSCLNVSCSKFINSHITLYESDMNFSEGACFNSSQDLGGALYIFDSNVTIKDSYFFNCTANIGGGAIYHNLGDFKIVNTHFERNNAEYAGAVLILRSGVVVLDNNLFTNNSAKIHSGAIYSLYDFSGVNTFVNNSASYCNDSWIFSSKDMIDTLIFTDDKSTFYHGDYEDIGSIPSYYNLNELGFVSPVKNQENAGACWVFGTFAALESAVSKASGIILDLSENNVKNLLGKYSPYGISVHATDGGQIFETVNYLASWLGPVSEDDDPYNDTSLFSETYNPALHVHNVEFIGDGTHSDLSLVKKAIMKYGGVVIEFFINHNSGKQYTGEYRTPNHAVCIVGWNDTMEIPGAPQKGAWIVKNSYGEDWGYDGYFYLSYYDATYLMRAPYSNFAYDGAVFIFSDSIKYDKNYQYDMGVSDFFNDKSNNYKWYKNVFYASDDEFLAGISTFFYKKTNWELYIYVNDKLVSTKKGSYNAGYYTIELGDFISLKKGDKFEAVFKLLDSDCRIPISSNYHYNFVVDYEKISFISADGLNWNDLSQMSIYGSNYCQVACIKAFTIYNTDPYKLPTVLSASSVTATYNVGKYLVATLKDNKGKPLSGVKITVNLNGVKTLTTDKNGQVKLSVSSLVPKNYNAILTFAGNPNFIKSSKTVKVTVKKASPKITAKKKTFKKSKKVKKYTITLKENNKPIKKVQVTIKIAKKTFKAKTNSKGKATFKIKKLTKKGKYKATITFKANKYYNKATKKVKITIK